MTPVFGGGKFGEGLFGNYSGRPKIVYTDSGGLTRTISFDRHPSRHFWVPRIRKASLTMDSGAVEVDFFHVRDIYTVAFEMLPLSLASEIRFWFEDTAGRGGDFNWYRHDDQDRPTANLILDPGMESPEMGPNSENQAMWFDFSFTGWGIV